MRESLEVTTRQLNLIQSGWISSGTSSKKSEFQYRHSYANEETVRRLRRPCPGSRPRLPSAIFHAENFRHLFSRSV
jgi:hypothetical protein